MTTNLRHFLLTIFLFLIAALLALSAPRPAFAAGDTGRVLPDQYVFGDVFTLASGDTLEGDLYIFGGTVSLEAGSSVRGEVIALGGNLNIAGTIEGDVTVLGGFINLEDSAYIDGSLNKLGGYLDKSAGAQIEGGVHSENSSFFSFSPQNGVRAPGVAMMLSPVWDALWFLFTTFIMAALAIGVVMFMPKQAERTAQAVVAQPLVAGGLGLLSMVVLPFVVIAMALTLILIPAIPVGLIILGVMIIFGWIALGMETGKRLAQMFKQEWHPALAAGLGTFALTFTAVGLSNLLVCIGWIIPTLAAALALGAVLLTRFGTRNFPELAPVSIYPDSPAPQPVEPVVAEPPVSLPPEGQPPAAG